MRKIEWLVVMAGLVPAVLFGEGITTWMPAT
jgi:hypothetical protein